MMETPLHDAMQDGRLDGLRSLVESGADVNRRDKNGQMALHCTQSYIYAEAAQILLAAGADMEALDPGGTGRRCGMPWNTAMLRRSAS